MSRLIVYLTDFIIFHKKKLLRILNKSTEYELLGKVYDPKSKISVVRSTLKKFTRIALYLINSKRISKKEIIISSSKYSIYEHENSLIYGLPWSSNFRNKQLSSVFLIKWFIIDTVIQFLSFSQLSYKSDIISKKLIKLFKEELSKHNIRFVDLSHDLTVYEKTLIEACTELGIVTRVLLHGLPARYNGIDDLRANNLIVWGKAIRKNYIDSGGDEMKIKVKNFTSFNPKNVSNRLELILSQVKRVLILPKSENLIPHSIGYELRNPFLTIQYLSEILQKIPNHWNYDIKLHPSDKISRICSFFPEQKGNFVQRVESFKPYDMVIGPTSTMVLESLVHNTPYLLYEPLTEENKDLQGNSLVKPFIDNSNLPSAYSSNQLRNLITKDKLVWKNGWIHDYLETIE